MERSDAEVLEAYDRLLIHPSNVSTVDEKRKYLIAINYKWGK